MRPCPCGLRASVRLTLANAVKLKPPPDHRPGSLGPTGKSPVPGLDCAGGEAYRSVCLTLGLPSGGPRIDTTPMTRRGRTVKKILMVAFASGVLAGTALANPPATITSWISQEEIYGPGFQTQMAGGAIVDNYMFCVGGNNGTDGDTARTWSWQINTLNGLLLSVQAGPDLPTAANFAYLMNTVTATDSHIYIWGGGWNSAGPNRDNVTFNTHSNGNYGPTWQTSAQFPTTPALYDPELGASVIVGDYLYGFGGDGSVTPLFDRCHYAQINPDGTLGAFQTGTTLPNPWWFSAVATVGDYIIAAPGIINTASSANATNDIYICQVNPVTGAMGAWTAGPDLPAERYGMSMVAVSGEVFAVGGRPLGGGAGQTNVWRATFNEGTGTLGAWQTVDAQLPAGVYYHQLAYSPTSRRLYIFSIRQGLPADFNVSGEVMISSELFPPPAVTGVEEFSIYR